jgi:PKD repeat protein
MPELLGSLDYAPRGVEYALIAELLELVDSCLDSRLGRIVELHNNEWQAAENAGVLADYVKNHPTIHHCGGVHIGGTHVLVSGYIDKVREITRMKELTRPLFIKAPLAVYKELRGNVYENVLRTAGHFNRKAFTWSKRIDKERIKDKTLIKAELAPAISLDRTRSALLDGLLRTIESSSDEELILFDFCHPYICCSDCSSIEYVVVAELKLYLPKLVFCIDDSDNYAFGIYPPGGMVKGAGVKKIGETYYFVPADSATGEQLFSYEFGGREVQLVANVMARPQARFSHTVREFVANADGIATAAIVQFTNLSVDADEYHWNFGDGITSNEDSPEHTFDLTGQNTFQVTLVAAVEACRDETDQELSLVPIEFYIERHIAEFCNADPTAYNLIAEPVDGGVFGENDAIDSETRTFHPDRVNLGGEKKAGVALTYQIEQQQATLSVDVYARPQPQFSVEILESGESSIIVQFINQTVNGSDYTWDFGDGETSNRPDPTHAYEITAESDFSVVLTAANGPCLESIEEVLTLAPLVLRFGDDSDGLFCENDETGVELIGTPIDGTFSGPGVRDNRFIPALVDMGSLRKKTVTLKYTFGTRSATLLAVVYKYPVLNFTHRVAPAPLGVTVAFTNLSINADRYVWDFGDGSAELAGYSISHFYKKQGVYQVTLRGINPPCEDRLTKTIVATVEDTQEPEIVPMQPLKALNEMLTLSKVQSLLKEFGVNGAYLADFYRQMTEIVGTGKEAAIAEFAKDDFQFNGPAQEIQKLGDQMFSNGRGLQEAQLSQLIGVYRLSIGNIMNVLGKRTTDLSSRTELYLQLVNLVKQAGELGPHLGFEKFVTEGFELVPQSWFDDLPNLQKLHITFGKSL